MSEIQDIVQNMEIKPLTHKEKLIHRLLKGHFPDGDAYCSICLPDLYIDALAKYSGIPLDKLQGIEVGARDTQT